MADGADMTIDLDAIEARANAATPGPWTVLRSPDHPGERHIEAIPDAGWYVAMDVSADDAAFIAAARTDIPALVARVRQLEAVAVIDALRGELAELRARENALIAAADADERAHRERAGLNTDGTMVHTAEEALSWLVAALFVERAANRIANEDTDELRATLANERGEGEGPSEGWTWVTYSGRWGSPNGWSLIERGLSFAAVFRNADGTGWEWHAMVPLALRGGVGGTAPTAREAMRQADLARAGGEVKR